MPLPFTERFLEVSTRELPVATRGTGDMREFLLPERFSFLGDTVRLYVGQFGHQDTPTRAVATGTLLPAEPPLRSRDLALSSGFLVDIHGTPRIWVPREEHVRYQETDFAGGARAELYPHFTKEHVAALEGLGVVLDAIRQGQLRPSWHGVPLDKS